MEPGRGSVADGLVPQGPEGLVARGLHRSFGQVHAVNDVDLTVRRGALFGLLGPDGAGKSTLIRLLSTVLRPDAGQVTVLGRSVVDEPDAVTPLIGYMSQQFCLYPDLTVAENLEFFGTLRGVGRATRRARAEQLLSGMGMAEFTRRHAGRLSGGMKQKLMLATTLMHSPQVLLLDEPTTGVDPASRREFWRILAGLRAEGRTVLVATPYMDEAARCTHIAFMSHGQITRHGTPDELTGQVPGVTLEIGAADPRAALAAATGHPGVQAAHLLGDQVRVLWTGGDTAPLSARLTQHGTPGQVRTVPTDMEAVFSYLADPALHPEASP